MKKLYFDFSLLFSLPVFALDGNRFTVRCVANPCFIPDADVSALMNRT
jgi:hypothetical protein